MTIMILFSLTSGIKEAMETCLVTPASSPNYKLSSSNNFQQRFSTVTSDGGVPPHMTPLKEPDSEDSCAPSFLNLTTNHFC